jgi:hypothetical protein
MTGSSGSLAAVLVKAPEGDRLRLERVEVAAGLFELRGVGELALGEAVAGSLRASGRRTCAELAVGLPRSRHRQAVRDYLGVGQEAPVAGRVDAAPATGPASESVELSLRVELSFGPSGSLGFHWHLTPGCGIGEMPVESVSGG